MSDSKAGNVEAIRDWSKRYFYTKSDIAGFFTKLNSGLTAYKLTIAGPINTEVTITENVVSSPQTYVITTNSNGAYTGLFFFHSGSVLTITGLATPVSYTLSSYVDTIILNTTLYAKFDGLHGLVLPYTIDADYTLTVEFYTSEFSRTCIVGNDYGDSISLSALNMYNNSFYVGNGTTGVDYVITTYTSGYHKYISNNANNKNDLDGTYYTDYYPNSYTYHYAIGQRGSGYYYDGYLKDYKLESKTTGDLICHLIPVDKGQTATLYDLVNEIEYNVQGLTPANI